MRSVCDLCTNICTNFIENGTRVMTEIIASMRCSNIRFTRESRSIALCPISSATFIIMGCLLPKIARKRPRFVFIWYMECSRTIMTVIYGRTGVRCDVYGDCGRSNHTIISWLGCLVFKIGAISSFHFFVIRRWRRRRWQASIYRV